MCVYAWVDYIYISLISTGSTTADLSQPQSENIW